MPLAKTGNPDEIALLFRVAPGLGFRPVRKLKVKFDSISNPKTRLWHFFTPGFSDPTRKKVS